jgi:hypothetical protein
MEPYLPPFGKTRNYAVNKLILMEQFSCLKNEAQENIARRPEDTYGDTYRKMAYRLSL